MQSIAAPALLATDQLTSLWSGRIPQSSPLLPYQTLPLGDDDTRFLLVPRWTFTHPQGPPVEMVEPLAVSSTQWSELESLELNDRAMWVRNRGDTRSAWDSLTNG